MTNPLTNNSGNLSGQTFVSGSSTAANMVFSAMLAEEHMLIVPHAYHLQSGLNE